MDEISIKYFFQLYPNFIQIFFKCGKNLDKIWIKDMDGTIAKVPLFFQFFYSFVPKKFKYLQLFLDKNSQKQPL